MAKNTFSVTVWTHAHELILEKAKELGVGWVRIGNAGNWAIIEPQKGVYHWESADRMVNWARANNIEPFISVVYTPEWARPTGTSLQYPPTLAPEEWKNFVSSIVKRYSLKVVGLWNGEPRGFFEGTEDQWVALIKAGFEGAKQADPNVIVCAGYGYSMKHIYEDPFSLDTLTGKGFLNYVDALDVHTYTGNTPPEDCLPGWLSDLRSYLISKGYPDMPLYCTEFGYTLAPGTPWGGSHTLESQAAWAVRHTEILSGDPHVRLVNYWCLHDTSVQTKLITLLDMDLKEPRPVYYAYRNFIAGVPLANILVDSSPQGIPFTIEAT